MSETDNAATATQTAAFDVASVKLSKIDAKRLNDVQTENLKGQPFYAVAKPFNKLLSAGMIGVDANSVHPDNATLADDAKLSALYVTDNGRAVIDAGVAKTALEAPSTPRAPVAPGGFAIIDNLDLPEKTSTGRASMYPFESLTPGKSFFVPNTPQRPDAYKSLSSTVSAKNKAGATENPKRVYQLGKVTVDGVDGAAVKRIS